MSSSLKKKKPVRALYPAKNKNSNFITTTTVNKCRANNNKKKKLFELISNVYFNRVQCDMCSKSP